MLIILVKLVNSVVRFSGFTMRWLKQDLKMVFEYVIVCSSSYVLFSLFRFFNFYDIFLLVIMGLFFLKYCVMRK